MPDSRCGVFRTLGKTMLGTAIIVVFSTSLAVQAAEPLRVQMIGYFDALQYLEDTVITAFEKKYDVDVQFERVTWANRQEKLVVSTAAGTPPDVFMNGAENVVDLVNNGFVAPIDKYIAKWSDLRDFSPATMQNSALNGHQYGVPLYTDTRSFWYRTDFFEEAGLDPNKPPTNWEQLLNAARRLTRTEGNTVVRQGFDLARWTGKTSGLQDYVVYLWQNGGELINTGKYEALFNGTKGTEAMQFMLDLQDAVRPPGYTVDAGTGSGSPIVRGKAAMNLNTGAVVSESYKYDPEVANRIRAIVPPFGQSNRVSVTFSNWLAIHSDSKQKDLAWEFIKWVTEAQTLAEFDGFLGTISPRRSTVSTFVRKQPLVSYVYATLDYARPYPVFPNTGAAGTAFASQYTLIINGKLGVKPGLDEAARLWNLAVKGQ